MKVVLRKASVGTKKGKFQLSNNRIWLKRPKYRPKTSHQLPELRRGRISGHLDSLSCTISASSYAASFGFSGLCHSCSALRWSTVRIGRPGWLISLLSP